MNELRNLVEGYWEWMRERTTLKELGPENGGWIEITTPNLNHHNDYIQIYARKSGRGIEITDGGETLSDLEMSGVSFKRSPNRQAALKTILNGFGVQEDNGQIRVTATEKDFAVKKHNLLQAIISVGDMHVLAEPNVKSYFFDDVAEWLSKSNILYSEKIKFPEASFEHIFDFLISAPRGQPEHVVQAIGYPTITSAKLLAMGVVDARKNRSIPFHAFAVLNDEVREPTREILSGLEDYDIQVIPWSERAASVELLRPRLN